MGNAAPVDIPQHWQQVGSISTAHYYLAADGTIVVVPFQDCVDTEETARAGIVLQAEYWLSAGRRGAIVVLMDPIQHQEAGARRVYQREIDPAWCTCVALVTASVFGRSVASIFVGLARPSVPTRMFADVDTALRWAQQENARGGITLG